MMDMGPNYGFEGDVGCVPMAIVIGALMAVFLPLGLHARAMRAQTLGPGETLPPMLEISPAAWSLLGLSAVVLTLMALGLLALMLLRLRRVEPAPMPEPPPQPADPDAHDWVTYEEPEPPDAPSSSP